MASKIILQGLVEENHLDAVEEVMAVPDLQTAILSVAFIRSSGVHHLASTLKKFAGQTRVFAGVRNGITSAHAIRDLLDLSVAVHLVDTGSVSRIYHPKVYFARGTNQARVLVGSANLTSGGLSNNLEASALITLDLSDKEEAAVAQSIEDTFVDMLVTYPDNVKAVAANSTLAQLLLDARLMDETVAPRPVGTRKGTIPSDAPLMKMKTKAIGSAPAKKPVPVIAGPAGPIAPPAAGNAVAPAPASPIYVRVWQTKNIKRRDLNVPIEGRNTAKSGSINLDRGDLTGPREWQTYFREQVFMALDWSNPHPKTRIEKTVAVVRVVVEGIDCGEFDMKLSHDTKESPSREQGNAMTRLSWGEAKEFVAREDLVGRTLTLYRAAGNPDRFMVTID